MKRFNRNAKILLVLLSLSFLSSPVFCVTWAVGTVTEQNSAGLSVQRQMDETNGVHVAAHFLQGDKIMINGDYQRFHYPNALYFGRFRTGLYSGIGIKAETREEQQTEEFYSLRFPLGLQFELRQLFLHIFADATGHVGELPETNFWVTARLGLRAAF